jgi:hypothetical protein
MLDKARGGECTAVHSQAATSTVAKSSLGGCWPALPADRCHMDKNAGCAKDAFLRKAKADLNPANGWYRTC